MKCYFCEATCEAPMPSDWYFIFKTTDKGKVASGDICPLHNDQEHRAELWEALDIGLQWQWTNEALGIEEKLLL